MRTVSVSDARTHCSQLLAEVAAAIDEWRRYRDENHVTLGGGITIRELIEEGRD